jgi:hypothetical protein
MGGFGAGKTKCGIWEVIDLAMRMPGNRILIARDTMGDLRDTTMAMFFDECPSEFIYTYRRASQTVVMVNGTEVLFRSFRAMASAPRNQNESKIKGLNLGAFYVDEGNEITKNQFLLLQGRLRHDAVKVHRGWLTTNPPNKDHWIYEMFEGEKADKTKYHAIHASSRENPHLPADFVTNLEKEYPASWVKKFVDGDYGFMTTGDPVYENFRELDDNGKPWNCRATKFTARYGAVHRYWDFGYHRPAVVWAQVCPNLVWKIHKEYMGHHVYIQDFAPKVINISTTMFRGATFIDFCDPAGHQINDKSKNEKTTIKLLEEDFNIRMTCRFSMIKEGIDIVQKKLNTVIEGEPAFQINKEECPILVAGFQGGYARERVTDGRGMTNSDPIKDGFFEHPHDALRYGGVNVFGSPSGGKTREVHIGNPGWMGHQHAPTPTIIRGNGWLER